MLELTLVSFVGVLLYSAAAACCLFAAHNARNAGARAVRIANWLMIAGFFVGLMALRGLLIEDWIEQTVRQLIRDTGGYNERRRYQAAMALIMAGLALVIALVGYRSLARLRNRSDTILFIANAACAAMVGLIAFRMLSLHAIDRILYDFRVNWLIDIGATFLVGACAVVFALRAKSARRRQEPAPREPVARALRRERPR